MAQLRSWLNLTNYPTILALKCGAGAGDGSTVAGAAEIGTAGCAVECRTWAVGAGRRRAASQCGAGANTLASHRALGRKELEKMVRYIKNVFY